MTSVPGESNPVIECLGKLREDKPLPDIVALLDELKVLCGDKESGNAAVASKNGAVELVIAACAKLRDEHRWGLASGLSALASVIHGTDFGDSVFHFNKLRFTEKKHLCSRSR